MGVNMVCGIKEEYKLRKFENRRMGNILEQTREEVTRDCNTMQKEEIRDMRLSQG
jgi:hypothetical protein